MKRKSRKAKANLEGDKPPVRLSRQVCRLIDFVQEERANMANAESTLRVLQVALINEDPEAINRPYYANVVELAADALARTLNALDTLNLQNAIAQKRHQ